MFVHDNGNLNILAMTKCGHTAMWHYFDMMLKEKCFIEWLEFKSPRIVVLRHPMERVHAAIRFAEKLFKQEKSQKILEDFSTYFFEYYANNSSGIEEYIFDRHCRPYMHILKNRDFRIIKFEKLDQYIPKVILGGIQTNTNNRDIDPFPTNRYFTQKDILKEIDLYENFLVTKEVITSEEWKELT
jgi:hypothetical protein